MMTNLTDDDEPRYLAVDAEGDSGRFHSKKEAVEWVESNQMEGEVYRLCAKIRKKTTFKVTGVR